MKLGLPSLLSGLFTYRLLPTCSSGYAMTAAF